MNEKGKTVVGYHIAGTELYVKEVASPLRELTVGEGSMWCYGEHSPAWGTQVRLPGLPEHSCKEGEGVIHLM